MNNFFMDTLIFRNIKDVQDTEFSEIFLNDINLSVGKIHHKKEDDSYLCFSLHLIDGNS